MEYILQLNSRPNSASSTKQWVALEILFKQNHFSYLCSEGGLGREKKKGQHFL